MSVETDKEQKKMHGVHALNREFLRYERVDKEQHYRLAEDAAEAFDDEYEIRTCDLSLFLQGTESQKRQFAMELGEALEDIGFAILTGHGIDPAHYERTKGVVHRMFTQTTEVQRMAYRAKRYGSVSQGYFPIKETSDIHPDLVEGWVFCRRAFDLEREPGYRAENFWPLPEIEPHFREHVRLHEALILPLMQAMLTYLGCDPHLYDRTLSGTNFGLRLNWYPPLDEEQRRFGAGRILGHEDVDLFTLLPAPDIEGLQVLNRANAKWVRLQAPPGSIILNTGDYMQRISNDRFPSTTHRVSQPRDPALMDVPRISFPMAVYVWENEWLKVLPGLANPKYEPIKAIHFHTAITSKFYGDDYAVTE